MNRNCVFLLETDNPFPLVAICLIIVIFIASIIWSWADDIKKQKIAKYKAEALKAFLDKKPQNIDEIFTQTKHTVEEKYGFRFDTIVSPYRSCYYSKGGNFTYLEIQKDHQYNVKCTAKDCPNKNTFRCEVHKNINWGYIRGYVGREF